ncbi:MAG: hypothetical protein WC082_01000 [Victivallales bacterium]
MVSGNKKKQIIRHQYTIVELLVVLVIAGILTGLTISGIKGAIARQGATGAVRSLATKISLAQSFAVSRNRYVALLMPDYDELNNSPENIDNNNYGYKISDKTVNSAWTNHYSYCFTKNRLCFVDKNSSGEYVFNSWVEGYEWQKLPAKTVAFITDQGDDSATVQVKDMPDPTHSDPSSHLVTCSAMIFKPSGALVNAKSTIVRIFRAAYIPTVSEKSFIWQGEENRNKGWKIAINGFTGRARCYQGGESIDDE